jgi:hypothetical protein
MQLCTIKLVAVCKRESPALSFLLEAVVPSLSDSHRRYLVATKERLLTERLPYERTIHKSLRTTHTCA